MVLVKMLMEIDPLSTRRSMVMMMAVISPSWRDISPAEQLRWSPRLVLPRFRLETAALHPESFLLIFSMAKDTLYQKMGIGGLPGGRARPPPSWTMGGPPLVLSSPNIFNIFQN